MKTSHLLLALSISALFLALVCCCCAGTVFVWSWRGDLQLAPIIKTSMPPVIDTPTPEPTPAITREPAGDRGTETETLLETTVVPVRDLHELAVRLRGLSPDTPRTINPTGSPDYDVGTRRLFHVSNVDTEERLEVYATLKYKTEHVYMWVEEDVRVHQDDLEAAAELFEEQIYPTNRTFFGSEWSPGVDNDPHLSILNAINLGSSVAGYYSSADEFVSEVREDSNEMEMFYINVDNVTPNSDYYNGVLAHEFQHMIHWHNDRNEATWMNEGFSELATYLNDLDAASYDRLFADAPDTQLNSWPEDPGTAGADYAAAYLFTSYFLDRFGSEATQTLIAHPENSFASVEEVVGERDADLTYEDVFADWVVANVLDDPTVADGRYGYEEIDPSSFDMETTYYENAYPISESGTVHQHGTDYVELQGKQPLTFHFAGSTQVSLVNTTAHSGRYFWWSNRGDDSDMSLTRSFDLSNVSEATLNFWTWYDIEENWDYAYVEASTDDGRTWDILTTTSGTGTNPNGNSFGWAYTGRSGDEKKPAWIKEQVDMSAYAEQEVQIRFEYITDDAINRPGFVLDDIAVPEIAYSSGFEADTGKWDSAGFIRHANVLPQRWLVQLILLGPQTTVRRLKLNKGQTGTWVIPLDSSTDRAVVAISGLAPVTTERASYSYDIKEQGPLQE